LIGKPGAAWRHADGPKPGKPDGALFRLVAATLVFAGDPQSDEAIFGAINYYRKSPDRT
jgi:hypothetical protein